MRNEHEKVNVRMEILKTGVNEFHLTMFLKPDGQPDKPEKMFNTPDSEIFMATLGDQTGQPEYLHPTRKLKCLGTFDFGEMLRMVCTLMSPSNIYIDRVVTFFEDNLEVFFSGPKGEAWVRDRPGGEPQKLRNKPFGMEFDESYLEDR